MIYFYVEKISQNITPLHIIDAKKINFLNIQKIYERIKSTTTLGFSVVLSGLTFS
jgi:BRCT domain type II-containing protein